MSEVEKLGFDMESPYYIPDYYIQNKEFVILRTCFGLGDWGIISSVPRKLKEKYPDCKIYLPSNELLDCIFGKEFKNQWKSSWKDPYENIRYIFDNNPYVDGYVSNIEGEIFHDHFRLRLKEEEPLARQILRFWQFEENEMENVEPELYFSEKEMEFGERILDEYGRKFGTLLVSNRFTEYKGGWVEKIQELIEERSIFNMPWMYWFSSKEFLNMFDFKKSLDLRHIHPRIQLYLKTKSKLNIGVQSGMNDIISPYAHTISIIRNNLGSNIIESQEYVKI